MKNLVEWYEKNLNNMKGYLEGEEARLKRVIEDVERLRNSIKILEYQIECAKKEGKDGFDSEKYKKVR